MPRPPVHPINRLRQRGLFQGLLVLLSLVVLCVVGMITWDTRSRRLEAEAVQAKAKAVEDARWGQPVEQLVAQAQARRGVTPSCIDGWTPACQAAYKDMFDWHPAAFRPWPTAVAVNAIEARPRGCEPSLFAVQDSQRVKPPVSDRALAIRLQPRVLVSGSVAVVALDADILPLLADAAVRQGRLPDAGRAEWLERANRQLMKPRALTLLILHNHQAPLRLRSVALQSERQGPGELVGMSLDMEHGLAAGALGWVQVEDRTCGTDSAARLQMDLDGAPFVTGRWGASGHASEALAQTVTAHLEPLPRAPTHAAPRATGRPAAQPVEEHAPAAPLHVPGLPGVALSDVATIVSLIKDVFSVIGLLRGL